MHNTLVLLVVGLTRRLLGEETPHLSRLAATGLRTLDTVLPAVTCTVQSTLLTGLAPAGHGAVANGWYFRDQAEVWLWRQSNRLIAGEKVWEAGKRRDPAFTCANMFWWYNMYSSVDFSATPRPMYPADGRKIPDHYADPPELRDELNARLGDFPLFTFWGPATNVSSSQWITEATLYVRKTRRPTLTLCYLPHLDYGLQKWGPDPADARLRQDLREVDELAGRLIEAANRDGDKVIIVSEYGIVPVEGAVHINRALRQAGLLRFRMEMGREVIDPGASRAFALADHQLAHIYLQHGADPGSVKSLLEGLDGVAEVLDEAGKRAGVSTINAPANWWRLPGRTAGSATIGGWRMPRRPITPERSISIASPVTTPWNCSWIRPCRCPSSKSRGGSWHASSASETCSTSPPFAAPPW